MKRSKNNLKNISYSFVRNYKKRIATSYFGNYGLKTKKKIREHTNLQSTSSKPIPGSFVALCHPDLKIQANSNFHQPTKVKRRKERIDAVNNLSSDIAATEESVLIDIVMDDMEETIALRRSIGTDADSISQLNKKIDNEVKDVALDSELQVKTENVHSQTIFLYDINEPSTSKGIRHVSMDVQCCTDATTLYPSLSPVSSLTRPTQMFGTCIKIDDSLTNINMKKVNHTDNSAATSNIVQNFGPTSLRIRTANRNLKGIKIEDSFTDMTVMSSDFGTCTNDDNYEKLSSYPTFRSPTRHSVGIKIRDSVSDLRKICNSGTSTDELKDISQPMSICTESPSKCTKGITVTDSYTDIYTGQHFDFGTVTNNAIEQYKTANTEYKSPEYNEAQMESTFEHDVASTTDSLIQTNTNGVLDSGDNTDNNDDIITENVVSKKNVTNIENGCSQTNFKIKIDSSSTSENPTYYNEMPNVKFTKGIKSTDYLIGADYIFPTMTDHKIDMRCRSPSPVNISFGFKVKGDDGNITKCVEWSSTRIELSDFHTPFLKHPPSMTESKLTHSGSEFYENYCCSYPQRNLYFTDSSINTSASQSKGILSSEVMVDQKLSPSKLLKSKLSCGGVQIHSYKEKQVSEDIVFQGEWQQPNPKSRQKQNKTPMNPSPTRNFTEISNKSKRIAPTDKPCLKKNAQKLEVKTEIKKPAQVRNRALKSKQETGSKTEQLKRNELPKNQVRTIRNKNVLKVSSKIAVNSITSKSTRNAYSSKRLSKQPPKNHIAFGRGSTINKDPKKHLAPMHTKKYCTMEKSNLNQSFGAIETVIRGNEGNSRKATSLIRRSKTEIGMELIRMSHEIRENLTYVVFRNELENNHKNTSNNDPIDNANKSEGTSRKRIINRRSSSPLSQNSSTCSTPDSIATVTEARTKLSARKHCGHSPSSNKSSVSNSDTDPISPVRNRKYKRYKSGKYSEDKSNKENVAESSLKCKISDNVQNVKNSFMGRSKNIYLAQVANESALTLNSKHQIPNKSFIPTVAGSDERKKYENSSIMMKKSVVRDSFMKGANENQGDPSNVVFVVGPLEKLESNASQHTATDNDSAIVNVVDNTLLAEWLAKGSSSELDIDSTESTILATMKQIVEDRLDFITAPLDINELTNMDAQIHEDGIEQELDETSSLKSFQTVITKDDKIDYIETQNITDIAFNSTFESAQDIPSPMSIDYQTDYDLVSFKSSTSASKLSEYFLTDDSKKSENMPPDILTISSVRDIFERKEYISPKPAGMLAVQAFSGFSIDAEPVSGDQPDYVNFVDSDVGSFAVDVARQATSEELFISGRSSESYESCIIDEDAVVPNWLFNIINQQFSMDIEEDQPINGPLPAPAHTEPMYDLNGNVPEPGMGVGAGAGAGDGRGMHSDNSQDSSGRGTSLSSSDTSSGQQSEAILIDPSAFTAQFEHDSIGSSAGVNTLMLPLDGSRPENLPRNTGADNEMLSTSRHTRIIINPVLAVSDGEADVSSLDTDAPDSSDN
ncbi:uncharacterized protein LOC113233403 isoform X2 [Hyposmocoma kahamanoa]|uniref:uncharacterized protein LOC113233403 isoform X2 n=1 Tax=Hyposmocoma kahamanoa TaxID=1477025 RepID=UPI000E6D94C1|nr:uncharacterized protein LOC113233403 isoform X2 [Hyposmocoma kahamanoa]